MPILYINEGGVWKTVDATVNANIFYNGNSSLNQRGVASWDAVTIGHYGWDRWKKISSSLKRQAVEEGNYNPNTVYTLSGGGEVTRQVISPASGTWASSDLNVGINSTNLKLELGKIATPYVAESLGENLTNCQRYYETGTNEFIMCPWSSEAQLVRGKVTYKVPKRTLTSVAITLNKQRGAASVSVITEESDGFLVGVQDNGSSSAYVQFNWSADAEL